MSGFGFAPRQARREVEQLERLARDARAEAQYAAAERLSEQAALTAERLDDLALLIKERFWLAEARRMQGKYLQAMSTYTWLIGLATDPVQSRRLSDETSLWYLANAFTDFVLCGSFLPQMSVDQLLRVVSDGLIWLDRIGKGDWAASLRSRRGFLLQSQGDWEGARRETEAALALKRRNPGAPGHFLVGYQLQLARLLWLHFSAPAEAAALVEEVLAAHSDTYHRYRAYHELAYIRLSQGERAAAEDAARECLAQARQIESPVILSNAYELLCRIQRESGQVAEAAASAVQRWRLARRHDSVAARNTILDDCARVRLLQARQACGLPATGNDVPKVLPATADRALAERRLRSVRRFVRRAQPLTARLDAATGQRTYQEALDWLSWAAGRLEGLLAARP